MLEKLKWGAVIAASMVLGAAGVAGIDALGSDDDGSPSAAVATATPEVTGAAASPTPGSVEQVSHTIASDVADLYEQVRPSVVRINASVADSNSGGVGSGIVLDDEGNILTNYHVIEAFDTVDVVLWDGTAASATVVGTDPGNDLAVLHADIPADKLEPATFGDSAAIRAGEFVMAVGNPFDLDGSVTEGIVSGIGRTLGGGAGRPLRELIQADAAINPGNSGGALFNAAGEVIGVTTAIENPTGDRVFAGIGYAVPSNVATRFLPQMLNGETVQHPQLGVGLLDVTPSVTEAASLSVNSGTLIIGVQPGTGADQAGLQSAPVDRFGNPSGPGDVIVQIDDQDIGNFDDLASYIDSRGVGDTVDVTVVRDGEEMTVPVTLDAWQSS